MCSMTKKNFLCVVPLDCCLTLKKKKKKKMLNDEPNYSVYSVLSLFHLYYYLTLLWHGS